jgi:hypothetical protein
MTRFDKEYYDDEDIDADYDDNVKMQECIEG